jgi:hypothetical protein
MDEGVAAACLALDDREVTGNDAVCDRSEKLIVGAASMPWVTCRTLESRQCLAAAENTPQHWQNVLFGSERAHAISAGDRKPLSKRSVDDRCLVAAAEKSQSHL